MDGGAWHYVRHNETTRQPRRHVFLDVEAHTDRGKTGHDQSWRVGVAIFRDAPKGKKPREHTQVVTSPDELWREVTAFTPARSRTVLWTHNLGYDVRVSRALTVLPRIGWQLTGQNLAPGSTWLAWRRGDQSLLMVDSACVFPMSIAQVGVMFGLGKLALPGYHAPMEAWVARCERDCRIMATAITAYLEKLEADDLGNWQMTGTAQSWAAFRHRHLTHEMLVHWDEDARAAERRAMWTGRCEAYWHGRLRGVRVDEWDMTLAYLRIAATHDVPTRLVAAFGSDGQFERWMRRPGYVVLAEVEVQTDVPLVPTEHASRIAWPVGSFRSTLWTPELRLLADRGVHMRIRQGWAYAAQPALAQWAEWIAGELHADDNQSPAWWKPIMKHWARAMIGRMAMSYREWEHVGTVRTLDVRRASYMDTETGETGEMIQVGHEIFVATRAVEGPQSMPQVTGYVQSACRATLTELLLAAPPRAVLYADTDSLLTSEEHYDAMAELAASHPHAGLRLKRSWEGVEIRGPRQLVTGRRVRISGIPRKAVRLPDGRFEGEVWESLAGALSARRATSVRITPRTWALRSVDARRLAGVDGWTEPHRVALPVDSVGPPR